VERLYHPSSPLKALQAALPGATITYNDGTDHASATDLAKNVDIAVVVAEEWRAEARDVASLSLPDNQDALIAAVAAVNTKTIVVLETGGPVLMPWLDSVEAVVAAWYPGARGGEAIAGVIAGTVNPSGRLPITFPAAEAQLPRPVLDGLAPVMANTDKDHDSSNEQVPFEVDYDIEGADVGYKWFALKNLKPLFPFGYGLSYTTFDYGNLRLSGGETVTATVEVRNIGARAGIATPQFYATVPVRGASTVRLIGWERVALAPGESKEITITADPRLLAAFDAGWKIAAGEVAITVGEFAGDIKLTAAATLTARTIKP
jgi:beta-glucosidase